MRKTFQKWLFLFVGAAFALVLIVSVLIETEQSKANAHRLIVLRIGDAEQQLAMNTENLSRARALSDQSALAKARAFAALLAEKPEAEEDPFLLQKWKEMLDADQLCIINGYGFITGSTEYNFVGYDMASSTQSEEFLKLLTDPTLTIVQDPTYMGFDGRTLMQYAGVARTDAPGFVQIGYTPARLAEAMGLADIANIAQGLRIGTDGKIVICKDNVIVSYSNTDYLNSPLSSFGVDLSKYPADKGFRVTLRGTEYYAMYRVSGEYLIGGILPATEVYLNRESLLVFVTAACILLGAVVFGLISYLVDRVVIRGIERVNGSLSRITAGDLDVTVQERSNTEFCALSDGINSTVGALKDAIAEAAARIDEELEFARAIQSSALPSVFPPYPQLTEFDLFAAMDPAKEVGGDFYDFYLVGEKRLAFLIADVSGKGIPGAMFMMRAKTALKDALLSNHRLENTVRSVNDRLCESNEAGMFVTAFIGILDFAGEPKLTYVNAGHNPPLLLKNGKYEWLRGKRGFVLGGMADYPYRENELALAPGDRLFLYTDGVTEATDRQLTLYGEARLMAAISRPEVATADPAAQVAAVEADVAAFVGGAEQADDITMLALCLAPTPDETESVVVPARVDRLSDVVGPVDALLERAGCPYRDRMHVQLALEEAFVNIASYAYEGAGDAAIDAAVTGSKLVLRLSDEGKPYNPLQRSDPDVHLPAEERKIGGLGVYLTKKLLDDVRYVRAGNRNILILTKRWQKEI